MALAMYMDQVLSGEVPKVAIDLYDRSLANLAPSYLTHLLNQKLMCRLNDKSATYTYSNGGNTITATYDDGCVEILTKTGNNSWRCTYYSADGEVLENVTTTYDEASGQVRVSSSVAGSVNGIVPFADATFEEIAIMLKRHYAGIIDLSEYWNVGDTKRISYGTMSAAGVGETHNSATQAITIIGFNHDDMTGGGKAAVTLQFVNGIGNAGYVHRVASNAGGWRDSARRAWMENVFIGSLDDKLQAMIKPVDKLCSLGNRSNQLLSTSDRAFLLSESEIMGRSVTQGVLNEGEQYAYFKNAQNRRKKQNDAVSGYDNWWTRSPARANASQYVYVESDGDIHISDASSAYRIVVAFCI